MKVWKKQLTSLAMALLFLVPVALLALTTGCETTPDGQISEQTLQDAAVVLRGTARSAALLAIDKDPDNAEYVQLAVQVLDQFLVGDDYTPGALSEALAPVIHEVQDTRVVIAINTVTDLYEVFYGRYARDRFKENSNAFILVKYIRDGAAQALPSDGS